MPGGITCICRLSQVCRTRKIMRWWNDAGAREGDVARGSKESGGRAERKASVAYIVSVALGFFVVALRSKMGAQKRNEMR